MRTYERKHRANGAFVYGTTAEAKGNLGRKPLRGSGIGGEHKSPSGYKRYSERTGCCMGLLLIPIKPNRKALARPDAGYPNQAGKR